MRYVCTGPPCILCLRSLLLALINLAASFSTVVVNKSNKFSSELSAGYELNLRSSNGLLLALHHSRSFNHIVVKTAILYLFMFSRFHGYRWKWLITVITAL